MEWMMNVKEEGGKGEQSNFKYTIDGAKPRMG